MFLKFKSYGLERTKVRRLEYFCSFVMLIKLSALILVC